MSLTCDNCNDDISCALNNLSLCACCLSDKGSNPVQNCKSRVPPKEGWSSTFPVSSIDERIIFSLADTKRHVDEGWKLYKDDKILSLSSNQRELFIFFSGRCSASMKSKIYDIILCLANGGAELVSATCSCPAGIQGQCKHVVAILFYIIHICREKLKIIPETKTCTGRLQAWSAKRPISDDALLFESIHFVKHEYAKENKKSLSAKARSHNPLPVNYAMSENRLKMLVDVYKSKGLNNAFPIIGCIEANQYKPVLVKEQCVQSNEMYDRLFERVFSQSYEPIEILQLPTDDVNFYEQHIKVAIEVAKMIESKTRLQSKNSFWYEQRQFRITSSHFGKFCKIRSNPVTAFQSCRRSFTSQSVRHGLQYESVAISTFLHGKKLQEAPIGFVVNPSIPFLGTSPDRLVLDLRDNTVKLIEVKCPFSAFKRNKSLSEMALEKSFWLEVIDGQVSLKKNHQYYYQVQGQLNICGVETCIFVVYRPPNDLIYFEVKRDEAFFEEMLVKLKNIYFGYLLPSFTGTCNIE